MKYKIIVLFVSIGILFLIIYSLFYNPSTTHSVGLNHIFYEIEVLDLSQSTRPMKSGGPPYGGPYEEVRYKCIGGESTHAVFMEEYTTTNNGNRVYYDDKYYTTGHPGEIVIVTRSGQCFIGRISNIQYRFADNIEGQSYKGTSRWYDTLIRPIRIVVNK